MLRAVVSPLVVALLVSSASLSAQAQPSIEPGARVRVTAPGHGLNDREEILRQMSGDTLVLRSACSEVLSVR